MQVMLAGSFLNERGVSGCSVSVTNQKHVPSTQICLSGIIFQVSHRGDSPCPEADADSLASSISQPFFFSSYQREVSQECLRRRKTAAMHRCRPNARCPPKPQPPRKKIK